MKTILLVEDIAETRAWLRRHGSTLHAVKV